VLVIGLGLLALAVAALGESSSRWRDADEQGDEVTWLSR